MAGRGPPPTMMRGRGGMPPMRGGRTPAIMPPPGGGYYDPGRGMPAGFPPPPMRGRGAPPMPHMPHSHPGVYPHHEPPGGYPDDSGDDITPDSGSPDESEVTQAPPPHGGVPPPGGYPPQQRGPWDGLMADNQHLRQEIMTLRAQVADQGNELARPGWTDPAVAAQLEEASNQIFSLHHQLQEMMTANQAEIAKLQDELKKAEQKVKEAEAKYDNEVAKMKGDIDDLTGYISIAKADEGVVEDSWFKDELTKFAKSLQSWVRTYCKTATMTPQDVDDPGLQQRINAAVPEFPHLQMSNARITIMQAVVNDVIVKRIFNRYCVGLTLEDELSLRSMEQMMTAHASTGPGNYAVINRWRALSISLLTAVEPVKELAEGNIVDCTSEIESVVFALIPPNKPRPGDAASRALIPLIANGVRISHHFKSQRARFDVISPVGHVFDDEWMEDASGFGGDEPELEDLRGKMVGACSFPAVIKWGNEKGEDYDRRTVIYKAKVLCLLDL